MDERFGHRASDALDRIPVKPNSHRLRRSAGGGPARSATVAALLAAALVSSAACGGNSASRIASRILERYRKTSGAKPLPAGGMIRIRLTAADGRPAASGVAEILWQPYRYRESVSSAGMTTVRGIESGKAYLTDGDGVSRVVSEPVLRELLTRSYFWRRAWLFENHEDARLHLGPADENSASVSLRPEGGNPLLLSFSRRDGRLLSVRSPRFHLKFSSVASFRDVSEPGEPVAGEITWVGLPTGRIPDPPAAGGGRAQFGPIAAEASLERSGGAAIVPARLSGETIRLAIDANADGPLRLSPALAARLPLRFSPDAFGRMIAGAASLEIGSAAYPSLFVQKSDAIPPGADAVAGGCLFREAIVELDPEAGKLRLHDPTRWVVPEGYFRIVIDDDEDRPVAILYRGGRELRLSAGSDVGDAAILLSSESADRVGLVDTAVAKGLTWGPVKLPPMPLRISHEGLFPDWGDDGRLGYALLLRFHVFVNMPQRWIYVRPLER